jgi:hypothetical protein
LYNSYYCEDWTTPITGMKKFILKQLKKIEKTGSAFLKSEYIEENLKDGFTDKITLRRYSRRSSQFPCF